MQFMENESWLLVTVEAARVLLTMYSYNNTEYRNKVKIGGLLILCLIHGCDFTSFWKLKTQLIIETGS